MAGPPNVDPPDTPELAAFKKLMASPQWRKSIYPTLLLAAKKLAIGTRMGGDDLAQDALVRIGKTAAKGDGPTWTPAEGQGFLAYIRPILMSVRSNAIKSKYNRMNLLAKHRESEDGDEDDNEPDYPHPDGHAEDVFQRDRRMRRGDRRTATARARLDGDPLAQQVFDLMMSEKLEPEVLAEQLGLEVEKIYAAQRRASYHANVVMDADPDSDKDPK